MNVIEAISECDETNLKDALKMSKATQENLADTMGNLGVASEKYDAMKSRRQLLVQFRIAPAASRGGCRDRVVADFGVRNGKPPRTPWTSRDCAGSLVGEVLGHTLLLAPQASSAGRTEPTGSRKTEKRETEQLACTTVLAKGSGGVERLPKCVCGNGNVEMIDGERCREAQTGGVRTC
mmetsp:Transcript_137215/g.438797  ORF Transcript_137215/g.438797 Transcript_137215/m.438797 type:complete len:179 (+) Transcript_137215:71-607(+)